jgi:hypothetical protein
MEVIQMTQPPSDIDRTWKFVESWEGGATYTNDPNDNGHGTKYGITQAVFNAWRVSKGQNTSSVQFLSGAEAEQIFKQRYWDGITDGRPWPLNAVLCDSGFNCGPGRALRWLEQAKLNVNPNDPARMQKLAQGVLNIRWAYYQSLGKDVPDNTMHRYLGGWLNRAEALAKLCGLTTPKR